MSLVSALFLLLVGCTSKACCWKEVCLRSPIETVRSVCSLCIETSSDQLRILAVLAIVTSFSVDVIRAS